MSSKAGRNPVERIERMRREQARRGGRRRLTIIAAAVIAAAAAVTAVTAVALNRGNPAPAAGGQGAAVNLAQLPGLQAGNPPWQLEYASLPARLAALRLPPTGTRATTPTPTWRSTSTASP